MWCESTTAPATVNVMKAVCNRHWRLYRNGSSVGNICFGPAWVELSEKTSASKMIMSQETCHIHNDCTSGGSDGRRKMKYWKKVSLLFTAIVLVAGMTGCSKAPTDSTVSTKEVIATEETQQEEATAASTELEKESYPLTVTDSEGNEVIFEQEPQKVISLAPNITEMMYHLEAQQKLVGRTDYCDYPQEATSIESVGTLTDPDIEKVISLEPDVVIASTHFSEETKAKLSELGIKTLVLYEEHEIKGVSTMFETLGKIVNKQEKSRLAIEEMEGVIEETTELVGELEKPSVYYVVGYGEYGDYTAGGDTFISQLITLAGGKNIAQEVQGWSYSLESLLEADPEIIIIDNSMKDDFVKAENYKELTAVKNGMVYGIDKNIIERQGFRNAEGVRTLAEIFHADAFQP